MIILDKPYVSDLLRATILRNTFPVVGNEYALEQEPGLAHLILGEEEAVEQYRKAGSPLIYTTSENSIGWIAHNLGFTDLPEKIDLFKDKVRFREMLRPMYPDYFFREVSLESLDEIDDTLNTLPSPFIIKPAVGFFSMGVHRVDAPEEWETTKRSIREEMEKVQGLYPEEVMKSTSFIIEEVIEGEEYAMDAYYDEHGDPVILSILKHSFATECDMSDRIYQTSKKIILDNLEEFTDFLKRAGDQAGVRNFPVHVEVRRTGERNRKQLIPIEVNPMRFGGWCTTADLTTMAFDSNPYEHYFNRTSPDWKRVLEGRDGLVYSLIILDNTTGHPAEVIASFDYDLVLSRFTHPLELRKIDHHEYPVFGILFTETDSPDAPELEDILHSDLSEFVTVRDEG